MKKLFSVLLRLAVTALLLLFLFHKVHWSELFLILKDTDIRFLLIYSSLYLLGNILALFRWQILLSAQGLNLSLIRIILSYLLFLFFNPFLPTSMGGDVVRTYDLFKQTNRRRQVLASVLIDRVAGFTALMFIVLITLSVGFRKINNFFVCTMMWILIFMFLCILGLLFYRAPVEKMISLFRMKHIAGKVKGLYDAIYLFRTKPGILIKTLFLSFLIQIEGILIFYFIARSFGVNISVWYFFLYLPLVSTISLIPFSLNGLGIRDVTMVFLFTKAGMSSSCAFSMSLVWFFLGLILGLLSGVAHILLNSVLIRRQGFK